VLSCDAALVLWRSAAVRASPEHSCEPQPRGSTAMGKRSCTVEHHSCSEHSGTVPQQGGVECEVSLLWGEVLLHGGGQGAGLSRSYVTVGCLWDGVLLLNSLQGAWPDTRPAKFGMPLLASVSDTAC
jgi:hypothetical protein